MKKASVLGTCQGKLGSVWVQRNIDLLTSMPIGGPAGLKIAKVFFMPLEFWLKDIFRALSSFLILY